MSKSALVKSQTMKTLPSEKLTEMIKKCLRKSHFHRFLVNETPRRWGFAVISAGLSSQWLCKFLHHGDILPNNLIKIAQTETISPYDGFSGRKFNFPNKFWMTSIKNRPPSVVMKAFFLEPRRWQRDRRKKEFQFACDGRLENVHLGPLSIEICGNKCQG